MTAAWRWQVALALILLVGAALRFHGLDWDQPEGAPGPLQMHPDERFLSIVSSALEWPDNPDAYFDTAHSPLNPYNAPEVHSYVYGTFPLLLARGVAAITDEPTYDSTIVWGRRITALLDTATIALVFALGWVLFSRRIGLLGAAFYALAVLPTQLAHFWTMDPYVTFFGVATLLLSALLITAERGRDRWLLTAALGAALGLGLASKVTAWPLALGPGLAIAARIALRDLPRLGLRWRGHGAPGGDVRRDVMTLAAVALVGFAVFRIAQPYAFEGPHIWNITLNGRWISDLRQQDQLSSGAIDTPPALQFAGRTPFVAPLQQIALWGLGRGITITALASMVVAGVLVFRRRELSAALLLVYALAIFAFQGPRFVAYMRYFAPLYPILCLFAACGCSWLWRRAEPIALAGRTILTPSSTRLIARGLVLAVIATTAWWALAFQSVYANEHPRIAASRWIDANVPNHASITYELWDDSVPYPLPGARRNYRLIETTPFDTDSLAKVQDLVYGVPGGQLHAGLQDADYVAITSNRVRESTKRIPAEYPATIRYYQLLESGELGFDRVATFKTRPGFLGISVDDQQAEESFTVYDHPEVRIYKKSARWDAEKAVALLDAAYPERAVNLLPRQGGTNGLLFTPEEAATQQEGGTFTDVFDGNGWASGLPWLWWLLFLEVAAFAALPWVTWLCGALPDRGYGLSKIAGLISVVVPVWLLVAWGGPTFSGSLVWVVYAGVVGASLALAVARHRALARLVAEHWPVWVATEAAFVAAFFAFLLLRAYNPDLWYHPTGGEKPMELAYLTAVARSSAMPPYDPWFAGGSMNYYYMGWFFLAAPIRAFKLLPEVGFNLGVPTFAAFATSIGFSTAHNLVALSARARPAAIGRALGRRRAPIVAGLLGAFLLVAIGNLDGALQTIERLQALDRWHVAGQVPGFGGAFGVVGGVFRVLRGAHLSSFDWWRSSRVHFGQFDITEFPYWSFLFGDLHPHLMGLPFFGLAIALAVAYVASAAGGMRSQAWALAAAMGGSLGLVRTVHTWDLPTAALITGAAIVIGQVIARGRWQRRWWEAVAHLALCAAVLTIPFAPFTAHFETFDTGLVRAPQTTQPQHYLLHFGVFVAFALAFLAVRYHEEATRARGSTSLAPLRALTAKAWEILALAVFITGLALFSMRFGLTVVAVSAVVELLLLNLLWLEVRAPEKDIARLLVTALFALAIGITAGTDIVTVTDDIVRMNTVFKFLLQAWQSFALASAYAAWYVGRYLWEADGWRLAPRPGRRAIAWGAATGAGLLLAGASIFLFAGTATRQDARFAPLGPTLNGLAYLPYASYTDDHGTPARNDDVTIDLIDDWPLMLWLRQNVKGSPVVAEAVGPLYHWTGRISVNTGLPAVVGWDWHQIQQRYDYASLVLQRRDDTARFYSDPGTEQGESYLRKYNVSYVVVGTEERVYGTGEGIDKFATMPALTEVYRAGDGIIYQVDKAKLPAPAR
jgi:YYY domain-containing protein